MCFYNNFRCDLADKLNSNILPPPEPLTNTADNMPYCIVADDAFAMKTFMMKPYSMRKLTMPQRVFNYRLSRARRIIENVFGLCAARFRVLLKPIEMRPEKVVKVVLAICALHNFLITRKSCYSTSNDFDREEDGIIFEGQWRQDLAGLSDRERERVFTGLQPPQNIGRTSESAQRVRDKFVNYFMGTGEVDWQYAAVAAGNY